MLLGMEIKSTHTVSEAVTNHHRMPTTGHLESVTICEVIGLANQLAQWLSLDPHKIDMPLMLKISTKFGFVTERQLDDYVETIGYLRQTA